MRLRTKILLSYLAVVMIGLLVISVSTTFVAPRNFAHRMEMMMDDEGETEHGQGRGMMGNGSGYGPPTEAEINQRFRDALNESLLWAGAAAIVASLVISTFVTWRITRPIKVMVSASQRIANGHYEERLPIQQRDEIGDLLHSFNQMAESLQQTEAMRQQLTADVAHELKTPLTTIMGMMEGLEDGVIEANPATFHLVHQEADRLRRLVQDLQELSRVEGGQITFNRLAHTPAELVKFATDRLAPQFADKDISLSINIPPTLPPVRADLERTGQVLINLLGNALQYTPSGGHVEASAQPIDQSIRFAIRDSGVGLTEADLTKIFQRFYRVDKSRSRTSGGSGIGLTIARHLIESQGGTLWAESAGLGMGSIFYFTLPLA
ncbi:MAG: HAMP domain-containing histidine kinase [Chloroflexi bacterium]|nr:HAMP domain-containing histidine kinase [Chloroflexota bacterium]